MMEMAYIVNMLVDVILCAVCGDYLLLFALMVGYFVLNLHQSCHHSAGVSKDCSALMKPSFCHLFKNKAIIIITLMTDLG